ncbi:efflux transporter periplasmic adaptor subunit [Loktanella sp. D2R18]|uniref:efflux RND transporter periplasmic adaptor subunit n=1 Tax=Rhodobacterales TaxID=204455 RepID=UPI000DEAB992|nr:MULTISPECIES: HlyD family efflux transporter periplasmic adaptor subunit [Rhodobacterales]MDO6590799.1 HlyD family efflux transporter periplasmic adaptor subunit [Yoonia sp. 1_MG-2023]RBW43234.1 efflux transporter periplasmic adaptor subunit [Loktanella sp. D2R18]
MRFLRRSLTGVFLLSVTLAVLAWAGSLVNGAVQVRMGQEPRSFPQRERVLAVNVATLTPQTITPEMTAFGELLSQRHLDLRSATGGIVQEVSDALIDGGTVSEGQLLLRIDPTDAEAALNRVRADLQDAEAELRDADRALILAEDELTAAEEQSALRDQALTRAQDLAGRGVGTAAAVETAEFTASSAQAAVLTRRQAVASAQARIDQATTSLARQQINLSEAERDLADTEIYAPFDGQLSNVTVSLGGRVTANELFAQLVDPTQLEVSFRVSTSQYARLLDARGQLAQAPLRVALDVAGLDLTAAGQITRESAAVASGQTGRLLFATLDTAVGFRAGDFVTVRIDEPALENVALVPATAVAADETVLLIGDENRLSVGQVELLRRQGDDVIVSLGDFAGRQIVAERSPLLGAGIKVDPIAPPGTETVAAAPEMIVLDPERRARLVTFVTEGRMPDEVKTRILGQLEQDKILSETVERLESRMGS